MEKGLTDFCKRLKNGFEDDGVVRRALVVFCIVIILVGLVSQYF